MVFSYNEIACSGEKKNKTVAVFLYQGSLKWGLHQYWNHWEVLVQIAGPLPRPPNS